MAPPALSVSSLVCTSINLPCFAASLIVGTRNVSSSDLHAELLSLHRRGQVQIISPARSPARTGRLSSRSHLVTVIFLADGGHAQAGPEIIFRGGVGVQIRARVEAEKGGGRGWGLRVDLDNNPQYDSG